MSITLCPSEASLPENFFLAECAVSGGTLEGYLKQAMAASQGRLCAVISPVYMDFSLPCPAGAGKPLTRPEAERLGAGRPRHFSPALCTEYFTYVRDGLFHAVLFDTQETLEKKLRLAERLGVPYAVAEAWTPKESFKVTSKGNL